MTDTDLMHCPFCGGEAVLDDSCMDMTVLCSRCNASPRYTDLHHDQSVKEAITAWNTRTPSSTRSNAWGDDRLQKQIQYSAYLQKIIEALCHGHPIPEPETTAVHHYEMAVAYRNTPQSSPQSVDDNTQIWQTIQSRQDQQELDEITSLKLTTPGLFDPAINTQPSPQSEMVAVPREVMDRILECVENGYHDHSYLSEAEELLQPYTKGSDDA